MHQDKKQARQSPFFSSLLVLDAWIKDRLKISTKDFEFDLIYVNGGNNLENLKLPDDTWKVRLIEDDFHRLMFDTESF